MISAFERAKTVHALDSAGPRDHCDQRSGCIEPYFLHIGTSGRWVVRFTTRSLYTQGKSPRHPLDRRLGGPQSQSRRHGEEKIFDPTGTRTTTPQSSNP
jgi:hypothetical protein